MKNIVLALFVLWFLSLQFYLYVPVLLSILLGAGFVSTATVALAERLSQRGVRVDRDGSLGL
ncbi:MAG TPA: hypothetical protein VLA96_01895 [Terriglobales bacterium]|jgi:hypothetical protein|nr:hypothetical protein [Terriglobales bacterium]